MIILQSGCADSVQACRVSLEPSMPIIGTSVGEDFPERPAIWISARMSKAKNVKSTWFGNRTENSKFDGTFDGRGNCPSFVLH